MSAEQQGQPENRTSENAESGSLPNNLGSNQEPSEGQSEHAKSKIGGYFKNFGCFLIKPKTLLEIAALAVVILYTRYAGQQAHTMNDTLVEIRKQTGYAATASEGAANAASTAADTLTKSIEYFRVDERAWIEIERIEKTQVTVPSLSVSVFRYRFYPRNVGKTAAHAVTINGARSMQASIRLEGNADGMRREQDSILLKGLPKVARENPVPRVIAPGATAVVPFVIDGQEPQTLSAERWVSYLIGRIDYADDFGIQHWMKFCFYVGDGSGTLWNCHEGNDEDNNPEIPPSPAKSK